MIHLRHAAAIVAGLLRDDADRPQRERPLQRRADPKCRGAHRPRRPVPAVLWADGTADFVQGPVLLYMKTYGLSREQLAMLSVVQREWAAKNPRATFETPITVQNVLNK